MTKFKTKYDTHPMYDQAKTVSKPRLKNLNDILGDLWVFFFTACHKAVFLLGSHTVDVKNFPRGKYSFECPKGFIHAASSYHNFFFFFFV